MVHAIGFITVTAAEIADGSAFRYAARFCWCESTVIIRCETTGQELQVHCAGVHEDNAERFRAAWEKKNGR